MTCLSCERPAVMYPRDYQGYQPLCFADFRKYFETGFIPAMKKTINVKNKNNVKKVKTMKKMNSNDKLIADYLVGIKAFPGTFGIQRAKIVKALQIKRSTVYDSLQRLERKGIVKRGPVPKNGKVGRRIVVWTLTTEEFE